MKKKISDYAFYIIAYIFYSLFALICIYPFYYLFIATLSDPVEVSKGNIFILPKGFTFANYSIIMDLPGIFRAFFISLARTALGTLITGFFSTMFAYVLTKRELIGRKFIYRLLVASMYVQAGLIPYYLTMRAYGLKNSFLLYIIPTAIGAFYVIIIKTYIEQMPVALEESAVIDGAGYFTIFLRIIIPLSMPIIAATAVFSAVGQWNSWFDNFILVQNSNLKTLQLILWEFIQQSEAVARQVANGANSSDVAESASKITPLTVRMTVTVVVSLPILVVYPFLQKYFVKGLMLGAVKG